MFSPANRKTNPSSDSPEMGEMRSQPSAVRFVPSSMLTPP